MNWKFSDRFRSNNGVGPWAARVVAASEEVLVMERWIGKSKPRQFELPADYLDRPTCGWKRVPTHRAVNQ